MWLKNFGPAISQPSGILSQEVLPPPSPKRKEFKILAHELLIWKLKSRSTWVELG